MIQLKFSHSTATSCQLLRLAAIQWGSKVIAKDDGSIKLNKIYWLSNDDRRFVRKWLIDNWTMVNWKGFHCGPLEFSKLATGSATKKFPLPVFNCDSSRFQWPWGVVALTLNAVYITTSRGTNYNPHQIKFHLPAWHLMDPPKRQRRAKTRL